MVSSVGLRLNLPEGLLQVVQPSLKLDYELNDPSDPEQVYYRSDHYSYAAKGIPIICILV